MNIKKMFLLAGMSLAAIAFAAPAAAQGAVTLTLNGNVLKKGAAVTATSKNLVTTVGQNSISCEEVVLHYTVNTNAIGGKHVVLDPVGLHNATTKNCVTHTPFGTFTNHITNAGAGGQQLTINTWGTATMAATFTSSTTLPTSTFHCSYTGSFSILATNGTDLAHVETGSSLTAPEVGCEPDEPHGNFTLTSGANAIIADVTSTP